MKIDSNGLILNVEHFDDCVNFYQQLFKLPEMFRKIEDDFKLVCLEFGNSYLMIESGGVAVKGGKSIEQSSIILRFNVSDVLGIYDSVKQYDATAKLYENDWGTIIRLTDPDGNPISIRDESGFQKQVMG